MFQLWLLAPLAAVLYIAVRSARQRAPLPWWESVAAALVAAVVALAVAGGPGFSWSVASRLGKLAALAVTAGAPVLLAAATSRVLVRAGVHPAVQGIGALAAGVGLTLIAPFMGVALACTFTGDCP